MSILNMACHFCVIDYRGRPLYPSGVESSLKVKLRAGFLFSSPTATVVPTLLNKNSPRFIVVPIFRYLLACLLTRAPGFNAS